MIQDIAPYQLNNQYDCNAEPTETDYVLLFQDGKLMISVAEETLCFPRVKDLEAFEHEAFEHEGFEHEANKRLATSDYTYLFSVNDEHYYTILDAVIFEKLVASGNEFQNYEFCDLRSMREKHLGPKYRNFVALTAKHLTDWYRDNRFCGRCGSGMKHSELERAMKCVSCGYTSYPRIMPAVIVGVINGNQILLTKYRVGYRHNALIAGFTEIGETVEETVAREVMEESGLKVKNIRYYKSQPWGIANDILMGFYCDVDGDTSIHMDVQELRYAAWVNRDDIELQPDDYSLTNEMMLQFKLGNVK